MAENLNHLNNKVENSSADATDVAYFLRGMLKDDPELDDALDAMYEASAAMYLTAIHTKCTRILLRNQTTYASKIPAGMNDTTEFQNNPSVRNLQRYLTGKIVQNNVDATPSNMGEQVEIPGETGGRRGKRGRRSGAQGLPQNQHSWRT